MSTESASNSSSNVSVFEAAQESKDNLRLQQLSPQLSPANQNRVSREEGMISGSEFLLLNGKDLARVWDQVDSMKQAIEELRSKIEENGTVKVVQSELTILREKLCESIDKLGTKLENNAGRQASGSPQDAHTEVSVATYKIYIYILSCIIVGFAYFIRVLTMRTTFNCWVL